MLITEIPECPESIRTVEVRELFMDVCQDLIQQRRLTAEILECVKGYCFTVQVSNIAETEVMRNMESMEWHELWMMCTKRMLEYSEVLGLSPLDRKNLGLL